MRSAAAAALALLLTCAWARCGAQASVESLYPVPAHEEDWRFLADRTQRRDDWDVLKFVRGHQACREVPVVVLTTRGDEASRETVLAAGATQYLTKPFAPQVLLSAARDLLGAATVRHRL